LLEPELDVRIARAGERIMVDHGRKLAVISTALIDLGIHAAIGVAPLKLLQSAGDLGRAFATSAAHPCGGAGAAPARSLRRTGFSTPTGKRCSTARAAQRKAQVALARRRRALARER
jgi:hypothetical protein